MSDAERDRLREAETRAKHWRRWGPYLSDRQWGTVREDYSPDGDPWRYLTHDMAPFYAYRWGEDGLAGLSDNHQRMCFALALWNGRDRLLKERLFGLDNHEGNHGEDVKECYWHLDGTPSHAYMRFLYRYPQREFPYERLRRENARRSRHEPEFELIDTGIFDEDRFFDVTVEYAKASPDDVLIRITAENSGPDPAPLHLLPTLWFRNDWRWDAHTPRPRIVPGENGDVVATHRSLGTRRLFADGGPQWLFVENETNREILYGTPNPCRYAKDGFHRFVIHGDDDAVARDGGTKCAAVYAWTLGPGETRTIRLRLTDAAAPADVSGGAFDGVFDTRRAEAEAFYGQLTGGSPDDEHRRIARLAWAGLLWNKQWYHYVVERWLEGDPSMPQPDPRRNAYRNMDWRHIHNDDILSVPDKWEFPWFAIWDSAFHAVALAPVDPEFAKRQLTVFTREWYMHPNGQLPAYEWEFGDVNPPVHAWATWRVYEMDREQHGRADHQFLESIFHKLLMNFTWWVNRKDASGKNVFNGGFLGMDNIGVFDRSAPLPVPGELEQTDGTSWMAMYCLNLLRIAWELALKNPAYEDIASKFFEHFLYISDAIYNIEGRGDSLWLEDDGFFYDQLLGPSGVREPLRIRSMVGLTPLLAVEVLDHGCVDQLPGFKRRMEWFYENRADLTGHISCVFEPTRKGRCLMSLMTEDQLRRVLAVMLDESEFLSPFGLRSLSKVHEQRPYVFSQDLYRSTVSYLPGESDSALFGGNSNWRGPVWFPMNYLIIDALRRYDAFWGDRFQVECPTGSGNRCTLGEVADELSRRLVRIFEPCQGGRPVFGGHKVLSQHPLWCDLPPFHEYFHGDTGAGLGARQQLGWTGLVASLIRERSRATEAR